MAILVERSDSALSLCPVTCVAAENGRLARFSRKFFFARRARDARFPAYVYESRAVERLCTILGFTGADARHSAETAY
jgi:hypothetical protein